MPEWELQVRVSHSGEGLSSLVKGNSNSGTSIILNMIITCKHTYLQTQTHTTKFLSLKLGASALKMLDTGKNTTLVTLKMLNLDIHIKSYICPSKIAIKEPRDHCWDVVHM